MPLKENNLKAIPTPMGIGSLVSFLISLCFPIIVSIINPEGKVMTIGYADVAVAFVCVFLFIRLAMVNARPNNPYLLMKMQKLTEYVALVPLVLIVIYFLKFTLNWEILLIGLGWRFWLLIMVLPYLITEFYGKTKVSPPV